MQELHKAHASLTGVGGPFSTLNFPDSLVDQLTNSIGEGVARKDKYLAYAYGILSFT